MTKFTINKFIKINYNNIFIMKNLVHSIFSYEINLLAILENKKYRIKILIIIM